MDFQKYDLISYTSVFYDDELDYQVNDCMTVAEGLLIPKDAEDDFLVGFLKAIKFLRPEVAVDDIRFLGDDMMLDIELQSGYPLGRLVRTEV